MKYPRLHVGPQVKKTLAVLTGIVLAISMAACGSGGGSGKSAGKTLTVAYQLGLIYAPAMIVQQKKWLEEDLPGVKVRWVQLNSGAAIRDAMLAGDVQIGISGSGAFVVGWANGTGQKYLMSYTDFPFDLMTKDESIHDIKDLAQASGKIATVAPDAPQATILLKAAKDAGIDPDSVSGRFAALDHASALQALKSGQILADCATPPFNFLEKQAGAHSILTVEDVFPDGMIGSGPVASTQFVEDNKDAVEAFVKRSAQAVEMLKSQPNEAAKVVSQVMKVDMSTDDMTQIISGMPWTVEPHNLVEFAALEKDLGIVDKAPSSPSEVVAEDLVDLAKS